jgi:hypothetical protein
MLDTLNLLRKKVVVGFVGGSDLVKQKEQIGENGILFLTQSLSYSIIVSLKMD